MNLKPAWNWSLYILIQIDIEKDATFRRRGVDAGGWKEYRKGKIVGQVIPSPPLVD